MSDLPITKGYGRRCPCTECTCTTFHTASCDSERADLGGYNLQCTDCGWKGFGLQLEKAPGADDGPMANHPLLDPEHVAGLMAEGSAWNQKWKLESGGDE